MTNPKGIRVTVEEQERRLTVHMKRAPTPYPQLPICGCDLLGRTETTQAKLVTCPNCLRLLAPSGEESGDG